MENAKAVHSNILKLGKNYIVEIFIALVTEEQCQIFVFQNFEIQKFCHPIFIFPVWWDYFNLKSKIERIIAIVK
jgi:hypothetical protein